MGQKFHNRIPFRVTADVYISLGIALLFLPISWVFAWCVASIVHEISHCIALWLFDVKILSITVSTSGTYIQTEWMRTGTECIVAAAGPLSGILLVFFGKRIPQIAVCAFFQTLFNILPFQMYDGGRVLSSLLRVFLSEKMANRVCHIVESFAFILIIVLLVGVSLFLRSWAVVAVTTIILVTKTGIIKIPCKSRRQIVQ